MGSTESSDDLTNVLRSTIVELVRREGPDLTARQLGVFLTCSVEAEAQTVGGLAARLDVSMPAITRVLDRLAEFDLIRRKTNPLDRRSVLVQRTTTGTAFLRDVQAILRSAASEGRDVAENGSGRRRRQAVDALGCCSGGRGMPGEKFAIASRTASTPALTPVASTAQAVIGPSGCGGSPTGPRRPVV